MTGLVQDVRELMALAYPVFQDRTTEILARDSLLAALEDSELVVQIQAQKPPNLDSSPNHSAYGSCLLDGTQ